MKKLDRLGWAAELSFRTFGLAIGIRASDPGLLTSISPYLPPDFEPASKTVVNRIYSVIAGGSPGHAHIRRLHLLYGNAQRLARTAELTNLCDTLRSDVNLYIAENAPRLLFVHAGAVGWRGRAILIPGPSFSGKTTLVQEFLRAGASYYSDEFAVLDARGFVRPFATSLGVRSGNPARQEMHPAEEFGGAIGVRPVPIGCVIATSYRCGARWKRKAISKGLGVLALLTNTVAARKHPSRALSALSRAVASTQIFRGYRGEAKEVVESVLGELDKRPIGWRN
jgi:hypothetical protein